MFWSRLFNGEVPLTNTLLFIFFPAITLCYTAFYFIDPHFTTIIQKPEHGFLEKRMAFAYIAIWIATKIAAALTLINHKNTSSRALQWFTYTLIATAIIYPIRMVFLVLFAIITMLLGVFSDGSM
jgi:hypothetical protein